MTMALEWSRAAAIDLAPPPWARWRVALAYRWRHGRWPMLERPRRFTEWVQWRKLNDRDAGRARLTDKLHSKALVAGLIGDDVTVPTLWQGVVLPDAPPAPLPVIVKANHGCGQFLVVRTAADWARARAVAPRWLASSYGGWLDEWHYRSARRMLLVEPFLGGTGAGLPMDYKVYVFGGVAHIVQLHDGRDRHHRWTQFDRHWHPLSIDPLTLPAPVNLDVMLSAAEAVARGHDFLRVDFYEVDGRLWFGEFCLFPGSGLDPFTPDRLDHQLGALWSSARHRAMPPAN